MLSLPLSATMGRQIMLHRADKAPRSWMRARDVDKASGGRIRPRDVVILTSPYHSEPFAQDHRFQRRDPCEEATRWFEAQGSMMWGAATPSLSRATRKRP